MLYDLVMRLVSMLSFDFLPLAVCDLSFLVFTNSFSFFCSGCFWFVHFHVIVLLVMPRLWWFFLITCFILLYFFYYLCFSFHSPSLYCVCIHHPSFLDLHSSI